MSKWLILGLIGAVFFVGFIYPMLAKKYSYLLILNSKNLYKLPRNFHTTPYRSSGSGQFSEKELQRMVKAIPSSNIIIVDLRQEPHGFLNGNAVSWYHEHNWGDIEKNVAEILHKERTLVDRLGHKFFTMVHYDRSYPVPYFVKTTRTEQDVVELQRLQYHRFPITDHRRPKDRHIDEFVNWIKQSPPDLWIHFHCSAGRGRTTTFLTMHDMMLNAGTDSVETIVQRQHEFGGANLFHVSKEDKDAWKKSHIETRAGFIRTFYEYCQEVPNFDLSWSEWIEKKGIKPYNA